MQPTDAKEASNVFYTQGVTGEEGSSSCTSGLKSLYQKGCYVQVFERVPVQPRDCQGGQ